MKGRIWQLRDWLVEKLLAGRTPSDDSQIHLSDYEHWHERTQKEGDQ